MIGAVPPTLTVPTPDGRSLDVWLAGPPDGTPLLFHYGTPSSGEPFRWARGSGGGTRPAAQGHLSLVVDRFGDILDELVRPGR